MELLKGKAVALSIEKDCLNEIAKLKSYNNKIPFIRVLQFKHDPSSLVYVKSIEKNCNKFGIKFEHLIFEDIKLFLDCLFESNNNKEVSSIMIQQPVPKEIAQHIDSIPFFKDVEGITSNSLGRLFNGLPCLIPCTAQAVIEIFEFYHIDTIGKRVTIIGRSNIVGKPLIILLLQKNATVTICHSKTNDLEQELKNSDIVIVAIGKPNFITGDKFNPNSIVIDIGTSFVDNKLIGDVYFETIENKIAKITPVPGGVGVVTNALLIRNIIRSFNFQNIV